VYGTITLIGFDGYVCALATVAQHATASIAKVRLPYMSRSLADPRVEDTRSHSAGRGIAWWRPPQRWWLERQAGKGLWRII